MKASVIKRVNRIEAVFAKLDEVVPKAVAEDPAILGGFTESEFLSTCVEVIHEANKLSRVEIVSNETSVEKSVEIVIFDAMDIIGRVGPPIVARRG